jgi:hypothetical protein
MCPHIEEFNGEAGLFSSVGLAQRVPCPKETDVAALVVETRYGHCKISGTRGQRLPLVPCPAFEVRVRKINSAFQI